MDSLKSSKAEVARCASPGEGEVVSSKLDKKRFSLGSVLGIAFSTTAAPLGIPGFLTFIAGVGGSPYYFWCYVVGVSFQTLTAVVLAESASAFPHAAGQTYWTYVLSPADNARFLTYMNGFMASVGWIFTTAGAYGLSAFFIAAFAVVANGDYEATGWQVYLLCIFSAVVSFTVNVPLLRWYPSLSRFFVFFTNAVAIVIFVILLVKAHPKASGATVFLDVVNQTGWSSDGLVFFLGLLPSVLCVGAFDTSTHLAEEVEHPGRVIPQVMIGNAVLSSLAGLIMTIALLLCVLHPENMLEPLGGETFLQLLWDVWPSRAFVLSITAFIILVYLQCNNAVTTSASRTIWAFARCNGLPSSSWIGRVHPTRHAPVNANILLFVTGVAICTAVFGPFTVLNGLFGAGTSLFSISYAMPIFLTLYRGLGAYPENRYFHLGRYGQPLRVIALAWQAIIIFFLSFPTYYPVTTDNMNLAPVYVLGCLLLAIINWFWVARKQYVVPQGLAETEDSDEGVSA